MESKLVSIIIPMYNIEEYIGDCLESVFNQTYKNIEILLIDDRGSDKTIKIVNEILDRCPFKYKLITQEKNMGVSEARNTGITLAKGEYIFFLDGDDLIVSSCIEVLVMAIEDTSSDIAIGGFRSVHLHEYGNISEILTTNKSDNSCEYKQIEVSEVKDYSCNAIIRRKIIINNNLFFEKDIRFAEDTLWIMQLQFISRKTIEVNRETYYYRIRGDSSSSRLARTSEYVDSLILVVNKLYKYYISGKFNKKEKGIILIRIRTFKNGIYASIIADGIKRENIEYYQLKKVKFSVIDVLRTNMSILTKLQELVFTIPIIDNWHFYNYIFKIRKIVGG